MSSRQSYRVKIKSSRHLAFTGADLERLVADRLHQDDEHDLDVRVEYTDRTGTNCTSAIVRRPAASQGAVLFRGCAGRGQGTAPG
jgi:hypothetical protein